MVHLGGSGGDRSAELPFFHELDQEAAADLESLGRVRRYGTGDVIFHEGDDGDRVFVVISGRVKLSSSSEGGKEVILAVRGPGDLVGELSVLDGSDRLAAAIALENVEVLVVTAAKFHHFLEQHPSSALILLRMLSARQRDADRKRIEFASYDSVARVATRLVELAERFGEQATAGVKIDLPISQEELAGWVGASREAVSKALQSLRGRKLVETSRRAITILDLEGLRRRAR